MKMPLKYIAVVLIICSLLSLTGCATTAASTPPLQKVTLQLKWFHQWQFAGYYAAVEKGYFRDAGLDVTIVEGGPGIDVDTEVLEGRADFGILASELLVKWQQGEPLVALAPIIQHSIRALMVRSDSKIDAPSELLGKKIVLTMNENPEMLAMFKVEGVPVEMLDINPQTQTSEQEFLDGKVDVVVGSIANQPYQFGLKGVNVHIIRPITYGIDFYGDTLFTSQQKLKTDPKLVEAFLKATKLGWEYAFEHQQELAELIHQKYAPAKTVDQLVFEANALHELTQPDLVEIGHQNPGRWQHIADTYASLGIISPVTSLSGFLYNPTDTINQRLLTGIAIALGIALLITFLGIIWISMLRRQVALRTEDLNKLNLNLQNEVMERKLAEENVRKLNDELEIRVAERTARLDSVNKELSAFSSTVSHDLRAPLRRIQNYAVIIGTEKANLLDDDAKDYLKRIQVNAESLNSLIENLLRLTKISQTEMALETVDLSA
ncbi:MAG: ABC transporter substrate-binding protein, partial [Anaerolineaceae bacterium]|nr:ABC transporter substrate-binding protein [Anaerolineaceae bacterium]